MAPDDVPKNRNDFYIKYRRMLQLIEDGHEPEFRKSGTMSG